MRYKKRLVLWCSNALVLWIFLSGVSEAREIEDILKRAREKYYKFREVATDVTMVRTVTKEGEVIIEEKLYKKGERFRLETTRSPDRITVIRIYDGENLWTVTPERGVRQKISRGAEKGALFDDWFNYFGEKLLKVDRLERLGGRDCYVLAGRDNLFLWIDRKTLALVKAETEEEGSLVAVAFSNFERIGDWEIPLTSRVSKGGRTITLSLSLDVKTVLPMELFEPEKIELKALPPDPEFELE